MKKISALIIIFICLSCIQDYTETDKLEEMNNTFCSVNIFNFDKKIKNKSNCQQSLSIKDSIDSKIISIYNLNKKKGSLIFKKTKDGYVNTKSYTEEDDITIDIITIIKQDSLIYKFEKNSFSDGYLDYIISILSPNLIKTYTLSSDFILDEKNKFNIEYLENHYLKKEVAKLKIVNSIFTMNIDVFENPKYSEIDPYSYSRILNYNEYGLTTDNIKNTEDAIFWYFIYMDL